MIFKFMNIIQSVKIIVQHHVVFSSFKRQQEIIFLDKLKFLTRNFSVALEAGPEVILWEGVDRLVVQRIGSAQEIFPFLVIKAIGCISFKIIPFAEVCGSPPAQA
ncbi:hypothetical protein D3C87_1213500 [compost metagenome]